MAITIKSKNEIQIMREAGVILANTLKLLEDTAKPGISTYELDKIAEDYIKKHKATPSFKGYMGFPSSICASINDEVVHGIPHKKRILKEGDILSIDIGVYFDGYHGDAARTLRMGEISKDAENLIKITQESFFEGMKFCNNNYHLFDISAAIQKHVELNGYSVVRDLVGHGIGKELHEEPQIPNFRQRRRGPKLQPGMVLAIEPMVNIGRCDVRWLDDDWTVVTMDGSLSAHYENTVLITEEGYELLTVL